ncbi:MAG: head GIN domain-containing protein [Panacibacter sp.]
MKKTAIAFLLLLSVVATVQAQNKTRIEPSGKIITKEISVKSFDGIRAEGLYELVLIQDDKESVKIEADDNLMDLFSVNNDGNTLVITMPKLKDNNIRFNDKKEDKNLRLKVYVSFKQLKNLDVAVIGNVRCENVVKAGAFKLESKNVGNVNLKLTADKLTVNNKGVGNITLQGNATSAEISNKGVGEFEGSDLVVQTMNIENSGIGDANVNVVKDLSIKQSFLGKVRNKGNAKTHKMDGVEM